MKRCFAIVVLSVFLITYLLPVATLVKADVVIGDNNEVIVNENAKVLGRKLALMESIPNLLNNGVTELSISHVDDLDEYLDSLWEELGDAVDYLTTGDWANDISSQLRNEALENITNYINYVGDRENIFANLLRDPTTQLLKEYVIGNNLPKTEYHPNYNTLNTFRKLAILNNGSPSPSPDIQYVNYINYINSSNTDLINNFFWYNADNINTRDGQSFYYCNPAKNYSWISANRYTNLNSPNEFNFTNSNCICYYTNNTQYTNYVIPCVPFSIYIYSNNGTYSFNVNCIYMYDQFVNPANYYTTTLGSFRQLNYERTLFHCGYASSQLPSNNISYSGTLERCLMYIVHNFRNVNIYVDNVPWSLPFNPVIYNPTLDIDGTLKIYGNDNTPQYDIQNGTQIDYNALYDTIYNAIINALPIDQHDITYYDSHDYTYSPTIINNYGSDPDDESDWIESILDYAIVPKFETAMLAPIETPLVNGMSVLVTVQDTIPSEILYVLGASFVLLLFVCVINKMIK